MSFNILDPVVTATHPLAALTAEEIRAAVRLTKAAGRLTDRARYLTVALWEDKHALTSHQQGVPIRRLVEPVVLEKGTTPGKSTRFSWTFRPAPWRHARGRERVPSL